MGFEECDEGSLNGLIGGTCLYNCIEPYCGDGSIGADEQCDDGNAFDFDGCDHRCLKEAVVAAPPEPIGKSVDTPAYRRTLSEPAPRYIPTPARTPTGPGLVIFLASGAAAGFGFARRRVSETFRRKS